MNREILIASVLAGLVATPVWAADLPTTKGPLAPPVDPPWSDIVISNNQIAVDFLGTSFGYTETGNGRLGTRPGKLDTEGHWVPGVSASVSVMRNWYVDNLYFKAEVSRSDGDTRYVGARQGGVYGSVVGSDGAIVTDTDFRLGKGFAIQPNFMVTPFLGIGSHDWDRKVNAGEDYTNGYYGAGLLLQYSPLSKFVLSADGLIGETFGSHIDISGPLGFSGALGDSVLFKLGLSGDYAVAGNVHINAGVEYVNFQYGQSAIYTPRNIATWEPASRTSNVLFKVGLGYAF